VGVVAAAFVFTAGQAAAEGLAPPSKIAAPQPVGPNWNGFYVGLGIGGGALVADKPVYWQECEYDCGAGWVPSGDPYTLSNTEYGGQGLFGTVSIGYDRLIRPGWVAGVFADYDFGSSISSDNYNPFLGSYSIDHNYSWAVGARLGFLASPSTLIYGTAGYTQAQFETSAQYLSGFNSPTFQGYFVGAGIETFLRQNWTLKLEYRYSDFGSETVFDPECFGWYGAVGSDLDPETHTARLVLSYKFGQRSEGGSIKD
jgi:outer membrane immunogenic protein